MPFVNLKSPFPALTNNDLMDTPLTNNSLQGKLNLISEVEKFRYRHNELYCRIIADLDGTGANPAVDIDLGTCDAFSLAFQDNFISTNRGQEYGPIQQEVPIQVRKANPEIAILINRLKLADRGKIAAERVVRQVQFLTRDYAMVFNAPELSARLNVVSGQDTRDQNFTLVTVKLDSPFEDYLRGIFLATEPNFLTNFPPPPQS